jgi:hypothetical protein
MKIPQNNLYLVLIFLSLLIAAILLKNNPWKKTPTTQALFSNFDKAKITQIKLQPPSSAGTKQLSLEKSGQDWLLLEEGQEATKASTESVDSFLTSLAELKDDDLVSTNVSKHEDYELTDDKAGQIQMVQPDNTQFTLLVGKRSSDFRGNYIRVKNSNFVYKTTSFFSSYFNSDIFK